MSYLVDIIDLETAFARCQAVTLADPLHIGTDSAVLCLIHSRMEWRNDTVINIVRLTLPERAVLARWLPLHADNVRAPCSRHPQQPNGLPCAACRLMLLWRRCGIRHLPVDAATAPPP